MITTEYFKKCNISGNLLSFSGHRRYTTFVCRRAQCVHFPKFSSVNYTTISCCHTYSVFVRCTVEDRVSCVFSSFIILIPYLSILFNEKSGTIRAKNQLFARLIELSFCFIFFWLCTYCSFSL